MEVPTKSVKSSVRFADFELDIKNGELRSNGDRTYLQEKPFQILCLLLESPGQLVTRDQLMKKLWPDGTFVDFDTSLNKAVNRLREALGDSADRPRFIETVPRRGYRFIGRIENNRVSEAVSEKAAPGSQRMKWIAIFALALLTIPLGRQWLAARHSVPGPLESIKQRRLTANSSEDAVAGDVISPDGKLLAYSDRKGIHILQIDTDHVRDIPTPESLTGTPQSWTLVNTWIRDGSAIVANATPSGQAPGIWFVPATGGTMRKVRDNALAWTVSRDGQWVAFGANLDSLYYRELWIMHPDGTDAHKVFDADYGAAFGGAEFSPDGRRLAYVNLRQFPDRSEMTFESRPIENGPATTAIADLSSGFANDWSWSPDGRIIYSFIDDAEHTCNFWQVKIDTQTGKPIEKPKQLTNWSGFRLDSPSFSADGKRLTFVRSSPQSTIYVAERRGDGTNISTPVRMTLNEEENEPIGWTADSKALVFVSNRTGHPELLRQVAGEESVQTIAARVQDSATDVQVSPDGAWVLYLAHPDDWGASQPVEVMAVPLTGGTPQSIMRSVVGASPSFRCSRNQPMRCVIAEHTPDYTHLVFTEVSQERGRGSEVARFAIEPTPDAHYNWNLSPDGSRLAILKQSETAITLMSLINNSAQQISIRAWPKLYNLDWDADGNGFYVSALASGGSTLLHVDLQGNAHSLWYAKGGLREPGDLFRSRMLAPRAVPSHDGRYLAIQTQSVSSNVWMIENF
jgi:DNA-binding winged helix-turn-helix (wHTH) protein/Tol biopolymer transport system component